MVQEEQQLRKLFQEIFEDTPDNTLPKETLIKKLQKLGYSKTQAIKLYNQAAKHKIIKSYLTTIKDKNQKLRNIIEVKLMTEEDWEIEKALDEIEDQIYQLRKQLHPEEY